MMNVAWSGLNKRGMQSLLGKFIYIHKCVKPAINRILHLFRTNTSRSISLSQSFYNDINWFIRFLPSFNGVAYIQRDIMIHADSLYLDACLTGIGGVWASRVYTSPLHLLPMQGLTIVCYEMVNFIIALRLWGHFWRHSRVNIFSDNLAVVQVVTSGKTKDMFLATCIRNIWLLTAVYDIEQEVAHIPGAKNEVADLLSRLHANNNINHELLQKLQQEYIWDYVPPQYFDLNFSV